MDRRTLLKVFTATPIAAALGIEKSKAEEKPRITYINELDLDEPLGPPGKGTIACSGTFISPKCSG